MPQITNDDAVNLCHKFGKDFGLAGTFESVEDFDVYYAGLYANKKYVDQCGFYDNGRIKTWLPYERNEEKTELINTNTGKPLLAEKFYASWYDGPQNYNYTDQCGSAYFGIVPKYSNILESDCSAKKCTACEIPNSLEDTATLQLNGLCKYSSFDKKYTIEYDPDNIMTYHGNQKSIISYSFEEKIWTIEDMANPYVRAKSKAPFKTLAIGNYEWEIFNDTECGQDYYTAFLSLSPCPEDQYACNNGLCIDIEKRYKLHGNRWR